ncbi:MAG: amidohydrolase family protein [Alphaproteobacteria bacterium]|nr:amidohydrolase family protein [Alphaproteobacteria bacterium]
MFKTPISADSHITEPPNCYVDFIDPKYRERAPKMTRHDRLGDIFVIDGLDQPVPMGLVAAAGKDPSTITTDGVLFKDLWRSGWDAKYRVADQDKDGIGAEIIYPTVGMLICNHPDFDYKKACFEAYNRWLLEYCSVAPARLYGMAQVSMRTPEDGVGELKAAHAMGFRGIMMPGDPAVEDYDSKVYDKVWETAVELKLPLSFHILTSKSGAFAQNPRGPRINGFLAIIRGCQDIMGTLIFGGVFDRHPALKIVCVEADAGWVPHYMYRMDHAYKRHRYWMKAPPLKRLPSEYFHDHIYVTFQDDWVAFKTKDLCNVRRLMWANDFPHSDSTWPWSQSMLDEHAKSLTTQERNWICHDNVAELYGIGERA